jgi:hypothetical protein
MVNEPLGYCSAWSMFFTELCLRNPDIPSSTLMNYIYEHFKTMSKVEQGNYLKSVIRGYVNFIIEKINKYFSIFHSSGIITANHESKYEYQKLTEMLNILIDIEIKMATLPENVPEKTYMQETINMMDYKLEILNDKLEILNNIKYTDFGNNNKYIDFGKKKALKNEIEFLEKKKHILEKYIFNEISVPSQDSIHTDIAKNNLCPEGKEINPKTGRCIKIKTDKTDKTKTQKEKKEDKVHKLCPEGKEVNPKTGRCIKIKTDKTDKTKTQKEKKNKLCPEGKEINPKTGRCIKIKTDKAKTLKNKK